MASDANRAWRGVRSPQSDGVAEAAGPFTKTAVVHSVASSALTLTFPTGHSSDKLPSRNIVPDHELPVYATTGTATLPAHTLACDATGALAPPAELTQLSNNIQLIMIPDKLILYCKRTNASIGTPHADAFLTIAGATINFNNNAGLRSSMTQPQLYKASVASGLVSMSWSELSGLAMGVCTQRNNVAISEETQGGTAAWAQSYR